MSDEKSTLKKRILDGIDRYQDRREKFRSEVVERMIVHHASPDNLHPNPDDEFSKPEVGPSDRIIEEYCKLAREELSYGRHVFPEPIMVEKMYKNNYMILNGHHRWAAAKKSRIDTVRIVIVKPRQ